MKSNEAEVIRFCFEGDYSAPTASGRFTRELVMAARGLEMPLALLKRRSYCDSDDFSLPPFIQELAQRPPSGRARIVCFPAFALPEKLERGVYLAITWFDAMNPTAVELEALRFPRKVWVPSAAHAEVARAHKIPPDRLKILTPAVNQKAFHPRAEWPGRVEKTERFKFLAVANPLRRKGVDMILRAYVEEFKAKEPVELVLKLTHLPKMKKHFPYEIADLVRRLGALNAMFPKVTILADIFSDAELAGLMAGCQVFLSANRGYYTGLTVREAVASGLPVIGPESLRGLVGLSGETGFLVRTASVELPEEFSFPDSPASKGEEIVLKDFRAGMREAFTDSASLEKKKNAMKRLTSSWNDWKSSADILRKTSFPS